MKITKYLYLCNTLVFSFLLCAFSTAQTPYLTWEVGSTEFGGQAILTYLPPGARSNSVSWNDGSGNLWLFGGFSGDKLMPPSSIPEQRNDLWKYEISSGIWTWVGGTSVPNAAGQYGTLGTGSNTNYPNAVQGAVSWKDTSGKLWSFGGRYLIETTFPYEYYYFNDLWSFQINSGEWTWEAGANTVNQQGVYGTKDVPATLNIPGARAEALAWTDVNGNFWLQGGEGYDENGLLGLLNDLWKFEPGTGEWTWVAGSKVVDQPGVYGTKNTGSETNIPGARRESISWVDTSGNLWLFGGYGYDINGNLGSLNDLWMYDISSKKWTWVSGSNMAGESSDYGILGVSASTNVPGARYGSVSWIDDAGSLWLFAGFGFNDLWRFNISANEWIWMGGGTDDPYGVYGKKGEGSIDNIPGARAGASAWSNDGNLWLFGGRLTYSDIYLEQGNRNDLWKYEISTGEWTWVDGSDSIFLEYNPDIGVYTNQGIGSVINLPGPRNESVSWIDQNDDLWLFGGGIGALEGLLNDLWKYEPVSGEWTWVNGNIDSQGYAGSYGTLGTGSATNIPGSRMSSISWTDNVGDLWLFGGEGIDKSGTRGLLNDLWENVAGTWRWMGGSDLANQPGIYGIKGNSSLSNIPGARTESVSWFDPSGNLWLFGGDGLDENGDSGSLNDLWKYDLSTEEWTWVSGGSIINGKGIYGIQGSGSPMNTPGARAESISWIDFTGNLWLFGGKGYDDNGDFGYLNDLWKFEPGSGVWTWMAGSNVGGQTGVYGAKGIGAITNIPGARRGSISWIDSSGNLWLWGGGLSESVPPYNDLWKYEIASKEWTWMAGSNNQVWYGAGVYGTQGQSSPDNIPEPRLGSIAWNSNNTFWLLGGEMLRDITGDFLTPPWASQDFWKIEFAPNPTSISGISLISKGGFTVNWTAADGAIPVDSYELEVALDAEFTSLVSGQDPYTTINNYLEITGLKPATTYYIRVRSSNAVGVSEYSAVISQLTTPAVPIALDAISVQHTSFTANWNPVTGADNYYIEVSENSDMSDPIAGYDGTVAITGTEINVTVEGLSPGITYYYRVTAENSAGKSGVSNIISQITLPADPTTATSTDITNNSFTINWSEVVGADEYFVQVSDDSFTTLLANYDGTTPVSGQNLTVTGLTSATEYEYKVQSSNTAGTSMYSEPVTQFTKTDDPVALAPSNIQQTVMTAEWDAVTGADNYYIEVSENSDMSNLIAGYDGKVAIAGTETNVAVEGLSPGITYYYRVTAENTAGRSGASNIISQITIPANPVAIDPAVEDITTISFKALWKPVAGVEEYELEVSSDDFANLIEGYDPKIIDQATTQEIITDLNPETTYKFRVRALNTAGVSGNSNAISVITLQEISSSPPSLGTISYSNTQQSGTNQTLSTTVSGGALPYSVSLVYKGLTVPEANKTEVALTELTPGSGTYSFEVTSDMLDALGLEFEITATDANGDTDNRLGKINVSFTDGESATIPFENFGGTDQSWNLFSIPYDLDNKSVNNIFADYDQSRHEYDWKIVRYRNNSNDYVNFNSGLVKIGEAYWFNAKENIPVKIGAGKTTSQVPFILNLSQGWNLIGNPYNIDISWNKVLEDNGNPGGVEAFQVFSGVNQSAGNILKPFAGGFVWSDNTTQVRIDPIAAKSGRTSSTQRKISSQDIDQLEWLMPLSLQSNNTVEEIGGIGMHPEASNSKDHFDKMTIPRFITYSEMYTYHEDYFYPWFSTDVVKTTTNQVWSFTLSSNKSGEPSTLTWDNEDMNLSHAELFLLDKSSGKLVNMKSDNSYTIDLTSEDRKIDIIYLKGGEPLVPEELILGNAYPNPARQQTVIPLVLPELKETMSLNLSLFDINGRYIKTLAEGAYSPGAYEITWDLRTEGSKVKQGIYFYRLTFKGDLHSPVQKKLIIR